MFVVAPCDGPANTVNNNVDFCSRFGYKVCMARTSATKADPLGIRLDPEEREALERAAKHDERPLSAMGRKAIVAWLREHGWLETLNGKIKT